MKKYSVVVFNDEDLSLEVNVDQKNETVWLTLEEMVMLFRRDKSVISRHINNILKEKELEESSTVAKFATVQKEGDRDIQRNIKFYNLDMIISVGYRVKSKRGIAFRKWASNVLKQYLLEGYTVNKKRLEQLERQISLINIASRLDDKIISEEGNKIF